MLGVAGTVRVAIPAGDSLLVERTVRLDDPDRARETLVLDLDASTWLAAAVAGSVSPEVFAGALRLRVE